ncbi:MAG TPA: hypothetical protein VHQ43_08255 [Solirubrobacterales bacterium]|nr:hypothetical protein [Solirubrobacterales bacterium]
MLSRVGFTGWLQRRIDERRAAAVVRFGDGEEAFLRVDRNDDRSIEFAGGKLAKQTGVRPSTKTVLEIQRSVVEAFDEADVLGILFQRQRVLSGGRLDGVGSKTGLTALYRDRLASGRRPTALARRRLGHDVFGVLPGLLGGRLVSVISCRDLAPVLERRWGLDGVAVYQVPSQYTTRDLDGPFEAAMHGVPIWPDAHDRVRDEITVREPGEVFLVGAGICGKDLCVHVRRQGGIALDMGSALDRVVGKVTRGPWREAFLLRAQGMSVAEIASSLEERYEKEFDREEISKLIAREQPRSTDDPFELPWTKSTVSSPR